MMFNNNTKVYKYTKTRRWENNNNNNNNNNKQNTSWKGNKENLKMLFTCDCLQSLQAAGVGIKYCACSTDPCLCCSNVIRSLPYLHVSTRRYEFNSGSSQMSLTYS